MIAQNKFISIASPPHVTCSVPPALKNIAKYTVGNLFYFQSVDFHRNPMKKYIIKVSFWNQNEILHWGEMLKNRTLKFLKIDQY